MQQTEQIIFLFIIIFTVLLLLLSSFIVFIIYRYKQKQNAHLQTLQTIQTTHENAIMQAQLEMQEQTFKNISREIHDNIGQKLALVKLQLITLQTNTTIPFEDSISSIGHVINDLSDLSRTMSADAILANGIVQAIRFEVQQLNKTALFAVDMLVTGDVVFLESKQELILFRIVQEALQNIIKHANATVVNIVLDFTKHNMSVSISDNGKGFIEDKHIGQGLKNIVARAKMLDGTCSIISSLQKGTALKITIPIITTTEK
jgi:two-component system, NarL family, sensor kinase